LFVSINVFLFFVQIPFALSSKRQYKIAPGSHGPKYIVSHKCNSVGMMTKSLENGANGIECDVRFDKKSQAWYVDHDGAFPWSTKLLDWLEEAKR